MATEQEKYQNASRDKGAWIRAPTKFHDTIEKGGKYPPEAGRYRLYVSYACPWAHRTLIVRSLKGLEDIISLTVTGYKCENLDVTPETFHKYRGWEFIPTNDKSSVHFEPHGFKFLDELYEHASPGYRESYQSQGKRVVCSVPILFDEKTQTIVTNESAEIIEIFNSAFNDFAKNKDLDLDPADLKLERQRVDSVVYPHINDGVYRCGFSKSQEAYEAAYRAHWNAMDEMENLLGSRKYVCGDKLTLSDVRLFVTLIRYDAVYFSHFKTSRNRIIDMSNLYRYLRRIYQIDGIAETVKIDFIVKHYYGSQTMINPTGVYPLGPLEGSFLDHLKIPVD